eukprot:5219492-Prorocentrum_lima.AAC.1
MTSSLVGSEMCIRDSKKTTARPRQWRGKPQTEAQSSVQPPVACRGSHPVSYTHLTLPTICSV